MRRIVSVCLILLSGTLFGATPADSSKLVLKTYEPESQHPVLYQLVGQILNSYHYQKLAIDDKLSSNLLDAYLENLDPGKVYFLKSDIDQFEKFRTKLDDDLMAGNVQKAFDIYNVYQKRVEDRINFTKVLLKGPFDFTKNDSILSKREDAQWQPNFKEMDELWRKKIKQEYLQLKIGGRKDSAIAADLTKRYDGFLKQMAKTKNEDVFAAYANSLSEIADPHTNYFSPRMAEDFNTSMSLSLEGIGATLQTENEYTKIREIVKGGPADKSGQLHANDKIVAVGQGKDGEMESILDWRIDDVVSKIRGKKGTLVRLEIIPHDATNTKTKIVEITRDKIVLEDQSAKGSVKELTQADGRKIRVGIITIPTFYLDFAGMQRKDPNYKSTTKDVRRLITQFKKDSAVNAFIIDLRNNGGGSLQEAVELTGLFIKKGPVVQVRDAYSTKSEVDRDEDILWEGPLMVMVNRFSASASEIFAAAMQDYQRAIVVGEKTFGKGTVQNLLDLNQFMMMDGKTLGQMKITIAKFYRVSGGSTQHRGVIPDIEFPSIYAAKEYGEEASKYALPYDEIPAAAYTPVTNLNLSNKLPQLKNAHAERMKNNAEYRYLLEDIRIFNEGRERAWSSLNENKLKAEQADDEARKKKREEERKALKSAGQADANLILDESLQILADSMK
ncbi:MAG: carboxy terminal-processing peptidase [Bacteroidia bacterium]|nr:carboxy terminal-processing peptidase [Bacteroidia bacterium]